MADTLIYREASQHTDRRERALPSAIAALWHYYSQNCSYPYSADHRAAIAANHITTVKRSRYTNVANRGAFHYNSCVTHLSERYQCDTMIIAL